MEVLQLVQHCCHPTAPSSQLACRSLKRPAIVALLLFFYLGYKTISGTLNSTRNELDRKLLQANYMSHSPPGWFYTRPCIAQLILETLEISNLYQWLGQCLLFPPHTHTHNKTTSTVDNQKLGCGRGWNIPLPTQVVVVQEKLLQTWPKSRMEEADSDKHKWKTTNRSAFLLKKTCLTAEYYFIQTQVNPMHLQHEQSGLWAFHLIPPADTVWRKPIKCTRYTDPNFRRRRKPALSFPIPHVRGCCCLATKFTKMSSSQKWTNNSN